MWSQYPWNFFGSSTYVRGAKRRRGASERISRILRPRDLILAHKPSTTLFCFYAIVCGFVLFFSGNRWQFFFFGDCKQHWQLNSLQNDVCFNHLGQKLWEKIRFLQSKQKFTFQEKGKSHQYELCVKYITWTTSKTADI